jgi:hypothetical protein
MNGEKQSNVKKDVFQGQHNLSAAGIKKGGNHFMILCFSSRKL